MTKSHNLGYASCSFHDNPCFYYPNFSGGRAEGGEDKGGDAEECSLNQGRGPSILILFSS